MIAIVDAEERPGRRRAGRQRRGLGLKSGASRLVLEPIRGEARAERKRKLIRVAVGGAHHRAEIGGEAGGAFETAMRDPRVRAALRQVLPAHENMVHDGMPCGKVIEILACVGLVAHQEAPFAEAEILNENSVAGQFTVAPVNDVDPPEPNVGVRVHPQADPVAEALLFSLPHEAIVPGADLAPRLGAGHRQDHGLRARLCGDRGGPCRPQSASREPD